jgi:exosome complex component RRP4
MDVDISITRAQPPKARNAVSAQLVVPGEIITTESGYMRGHGTYVEEEDLKASVSGAVERVNKLVSVKSLKARYVGDVGDVVVGRITEVGQNRWRVDVNSRQDAVLLLSSINLPGGVRRRRTVEDTLHMRQFFVENELIVAEVQQFFQDGGISLHTRNKYGKLEHGLFIAVPPGLVKRTRSHFTKLPCGVDMVIGLNGYIWLSDHVPDEEDREREAQEEQQVTRVIESIPADLREKLSRVRNSVVALCRRFLAIHPATITDVYNASLNYAVRDMLKPDLLVELTAAAAERAAEQ